MEGNDGKWGDELGGFAAIQVREMKTRTWETAVVKSGQILDRLKANPTVLWNIRYLVGRVVKARASIQTIFETGKDGTQK